LEADFQAKQRLPANHFNWLKTHSRAALRFRSLAITLLFVFQFPTSLCSLGGGRRSVTVSLKLPWTYAPLAAAAAPSPAPSSRLGHRCPDRLCDRGALLALGDVGRDFLLLLFVYIHVQLYSKGGCPPLCSKGGCPPLCNAIASGTVRSDIMFQLQMYYHRCKADVKTQLQRWKR
jgi:hypothetical protein